MAGVLQRVIGLLTISSGHLCRTKVFDPDYEYTDQFVDLTLFDEIIIVDVTKSASPPSSASFGVFVDQVRDRCFLPLALGGRVLSLTEAERMFELGADRVVIGSAVFSNPGLVMDVASRWGSQAVVGSINVVRSGGRLCAVSSSRPDIPQGDAHDVMSRMIELGAGEILLNFVNRDGSLQGPDLDGTSALVDGCPVPCVVAGGIGNWSHMYTALRIVGVSGVATSNIYHLSAASIVAAKQYLAERNIPVRFGNLNVRGNSHA